MLPGALAQGITDAGGIGLAGELYQSLAAAQGIPTAPAASTAPATPGTPGGQTAPGAR